VHQFTVQQKWVKEVKQGTNSHSAQNPSWSMHKHAHQKATYPLCLHQFTTQQKGKGGKQGSTQSPIMSMHKNSFKGNLPNPESAPVHDTASG